MGYQYTYSGCFHLSAPLSIEDATDLFWIFSGDRDEDYTPDSCANWEITGDRAGICGPEDCYRDRSDEEWLVWLADWLKKREITIEGTVRRTGESSGDASDFVIYEDEFGDAVIEARPAVLILSREVFINDVLDRAALELDEGSRSAIIAAFWDACDHWSEEETLETPDDRYAPDGDGGGEEDYD